VKRNRDQNSVNWNARTNGGGGGEGAYLDMGSCCCSQVKNPVGSGVVQWATLRLVGKRKTNRSTDQIIEAEFRDKKKGPGARSELEDGPKRGGMVEKQGSKK